MAYFVTLTLHLFAAILFVGTVFFEVLILASIRRKVGREAMRAVEAAVGRRARQVMPFVLLVLYGAGITMAWGYRAHLAEPFASPFAIMLSLKILLALSVLGHFVFAVTRGARGILRAGQARFVHVSVFCHVIAIVFLAKAMFFLTW